MKKIAVFFSHSMFIDNFVVLELDSVFKSSVLLRTEKQFEKQKEIFNHAKTIYPNNMKEVVKSYLISNYRKDEVMCFNIDEKSEFEITDMRGLLVDSQAVIKIEVIKNRYNNSFDVKLKEVGESHVNVYCL